MIYPEYHSTHSQKIHNLLTKIKENNGFLGQITEEDRKLIFPLLAVVEKSEITGLDIQWSLTTEGKKVLKSQNSLLRWRRKQGPSWWSDVSYKEDVPVPLTIEVLDALKSILETGHPETEKLDILSRIQISGNHAAYQTLDGDRKYRTVQGSLAKEKDGIWSLTNAGLILAKAHIRKKDCAQFTGKVI